MTHTLIKETNQTEAEVYDMNYIHSLNWLSYLKNVNDVQNNINKKQ